VARRAGRSGTTVALTLLAVTVATSAGTQPAHALGATSRYVAVAPTRLLDTRSGLGAPAGKVATSTTVNVQITGKAGIPASATAVVLNVTATATNGGGFITAFPAGGAVPVVSNLNPNDAGQTIANLVTVPIGRSGGVGLFTSVGTHLIADAFGYYEPATSASSGRLVALAPARVFDSRSGAPIGEKGTRTLSLAKWLPSDAVAAVLNITVDQPDSAGYVTVWAAGTAQPGTSNLNIDTSGQTVANQVIVPVTAAGVSVYSSTSTHLIADVSGYFTGPSAPKASTGLFVPLSPERVLDTREEGALNPLGAGIRPLPGWTVEMSLVGRAKIPFDASAVALNTTLVDAGRAGYVTVYPAGIALPNSSSLNATHPGHTIANHVVASTSTRGVSLFSSGGGHLLADVSGYFTGAPIAAVIAPVANPAPKPTFPMSLSIPAIGITTPVNEGIDIAGLDASAGHWPGSALPGKGGNMAVFGHRTSHTHPFRDLDRLSNGDEIVVESNGLTYRYRVTKTIITGATDAETIGQWTSGATLSLVACHPPGSVDYRIVVRASLVDIS
jgi:LPXTG-site transpeptidase (sortase) family protein